MPGLDNCSFRSSSHVVLLCLRGLGRGKGGHSGWQLPSVINAGGLLPARARSTGLGVRHTPVGILDMGYPDCGTEASHVNILWLSFLN